MKLYLVVKVDINDADYITEFYELQSMEDIKEFLPLIEEIKNFKPYETPYIGYGGNIGKTTHHHNWNFEPREDMGEKDPTKIYTSISQETIEDFHDLYVPRGENCQCCHTIKSIDIFEVNNINKLL